MTAPDPYAEVSPYLLQEVGRIASNWATLETILDAYVAMLFQKADWPRKPESIPISLKRKITMIKNCLNDLPLLASFQQEGLAIMSRIGRLSKDRHWVLHGTLLSSQPDNDGTYEFVMYEFSKRIIHTLVRRRLSIVALGAIADEIRTLQRDALGLLLQIGDRGFSIWTNATTD